MSLSAKTFQRKLENLESELLASRSVGVHDWAANELKALSNLIRSSHVTDENADPNFPDLTMSSFLSRSITPDILPFHRDITSSSPSVFVESELVDDFKSTSSQEEEILGDQFFPDPLPIICKPNLFFTRYEPIDFDLSRSDIERARSGFLEFWKEKELVWEKMRDSVLNVKKDQPASSLCQPLPPAPPTLAVETNSAIIRSALTGTCLPGELFEFQRDEIFHIMKQTSSSRYIILFSETNQFSGLYAVFDDGVAHRVYLIPDSHYPCPHQIVPAIVQRRFRYTYASGFVEIGSRYNTRGFWDNIDAVTLKLLSKQLN